MARKTVKEDSLTVSVDQAAHILGISEYLAYKLVGTGEIPSVRMGTKMIRVSKARLVELVNGGNLVTEDSKA